MKADSGLWHHRLGTRGPAMSLDEISYAAGEMSFENRRRSETIDLARHLAAAHELFHSTGAVTASASTHPETNDDFEHLRWFPYPDEVIASPE